MNTFKIMKYQLRDVFRSRWLLFYIGFFWLITDALFRFGGAGDRVILSLMNVVIIVIPLMSIILGAMFVYNSREYIELLLVQPVSRRELFAGLFGGLTLPMSAGFIAGTTFPFIYNGVIAEVGSSVLFLIVTGVLLNVIFVALAFLMAFKNQDKIKGLGLAIAVWLFFTVIYDGLILLTIYAFSGYPMQYPVILMSMLNPVDLGRIVLLLNFDISALMGFTGAVFQKFFGTGFGLSLALTSMILWLSIPLILSMRIFLKKDF